MHYNYQLSIVIPGIRNENWNEITGQIALACKTLKYELIFVGPHALPKELANLQNIKYVKELGTPSRALQIGTLFAEGEYFTWVVDDARVEQDSIDLAMSLLLSNDSSKDIIGMRYCEGENYSGKEFPKDYWRAGHHKDLTRPGVNPEWTATGIMLMSTNYYRSLGGIDCRFEHINMNIHDFAFRAQKNGSIVHLSPNNVLNCSWDSRRTPENNAVVAAFFQNDNSLFQQIYASDDRQIIIDFDNWRESPVVWQRRVDIHGA